MATPKVKGPTETTMAMRKIEAGGGTIGDLGTGMPGDVCQVDMEWEFGQGFISLREIPR